MTIKRTVDATVSDTIRKQHVQPFHILDLELPTGTVYLSEGPQVEFDNGTGTHNYLAGRFQVESVSWPGDGGQSCAIELYNENDVATTWFIQNRMADATVVLWFVYKRSDGTFSVPVKYIVGSCDASELTPDSLKVQIQPPNRERKFFPNTQISSAGFNHLPQERAVVFWNNTTHVLEREYD